jgi:shikimate dehydrogenase
VSIDADTRLVGLLGHPLGHSLSPAMHNRAFAALGLNFHYLPIPVTPANLACAAAGLACMNFAGYNVTIPHKVAIMEHLEAVDELARIIGAVNTVVLRDGRATGYNTDGAGYLKALAAQGGIGVEGRRIVVLGAGGAARAIAMTLASSGAREIVLANRTQARAQALAADVNTRLRPCCRAAPLEPEALKGALTRAEVLINTTSIGMHPLAERLPLDAGLLHRDLVVSDIVYNPRQTRLLMEAAARGCRVVHGDGMLVYQGAEGFRHWTGRAAPVEVMFAALRERLGG